MVDLAAYSLPLFAALTLAVQFAALWIGNRIGCWQAARNPVVTSTPHERVGIVVGGLLALLGFTLGLMISLAETRFEQRSRTALDEANAIGTAWLRAHAVAHPRGAEVAHLLEDYARIRLAWVEAPRDGNALAESTAATDRAQAVLWGHAMALARERTDPVAQGLLASLNSVFDLASAQRWAFIGQIPSQLPWLLLALTVVGVGGIGFQWGLMGQWHPVVATLLLGAWSACLMLIADLANPRIGWVRVDVAPYLWTLESFRNGVPIPALR